MSMAMTLLNMRTQLRANARRDTTVITDATLDQFINWTQTRIADLYVFDEMLESYTADVGSGQLRYSWPARLKGVISLKLMDGTNSRKLYSIKARDMDSARPYPDSYTGRPGYYVDFGSYFELHDIPDASTYDLFLRCSIYPRDLTTDSQTSDLSQKDLVVIAGATALAFLWQKEVEEATRWDQVFQRLMGEKVAAEGGSRDWEPVAQPFSSVAPVVDPRRPLDSFFGR